MTSFLFDLSLLDNGAEFLRLFDDEGLEFVRRIRGWQGAQPFETSDYFRLCQGTPHTRVELVDHGWWRPCRCEQAKPVDDLVTFQPRVSLIAGTSGRVGNRCAEVTPMARARPSWMNGWMAARPA